MNVILSNLMHVLLVLLLLLLIGSLWDPSDWSHNSISPSIILAYAYWQLAKLIELSIFHEQFLSCYDWLLRDITNSVSANI